jgi:hypothetical protein
MRTDRTGAVKQTVVVSGALANKPMNGGNAWSRLSWVEGLRRLGYQVCFVEEIGAESCVDSEGEPTTFERSVNREYFERTMVWAGLSGCSALIYAGGEEVWGMAMGALVERMRGAVLLNLSGHLAHPDLRRKAGCEVYLDDDPGFTQFWEASGVLGGKLREHDVYFTLGMNIGTDASPIPTVGIRWGHTRPPAVLADWPACPASGLERFTTVASWRGAYGPVVYGGRTYGVKAHEFRKFLELPKRSGQLFEIALQIHPADGRDLAALRAMGWRVVDPVRSTGSPEAFRAYVQGSGGEFSAAQGVYVETRSGWFSDRTVRYLASGRPVLVQDTGLGGHYPLGEGLLTFRTLDEAVDGAERLRKDYARHCCGARRVAEEFFDSDRVIGAVLEAVGAGGVSGRAGGLKRRGAR